MRRTVEGNSAIVTEGTYLIRDVLSSCLLEEISGLVGDLFVHTTRFGRVDFACL